MEAGVGFGECEDGFVAVAAGGDDVFREAFAAEFVSRGRSVFGEQVGERDSGVGLVGVGVDVVEGDGLVGELCKILKFQHANRAVLHDKN